jgi:hypothetical protein
VTRMAQARSDNEAGFRTYTVTRDYRLFGQQDPSAKSHVIADVKSTPPGTKEFAIRQTAGTGLGEKIVRCILTGEAELTNSDTSELSPANYDFRYLGEEEINGRHSYVLELRPKREDKHLISGKAWVDSETYLLNRAEGEPAKNLPGGCGISVSWSRTGTSKGCGCRRAWRQLPRSEWSETAKWSRAM